MSSISISSGADTSRRCVVDRLETYQNKLPRGGGGSEGGLAVDRAGMPGGGGPAEFSIYSSADLERASGLGQHPVTGD